MQRFNPKSIRIGEIVRKPYNFTKAIFLIEITLVRSQALNSRRKTLHFLVVLVVSKTVTRNSQPIEKLTVFTVILTMAKSGMENAEVGKKNAMKILNYL